MKLRHMLPCVLLALLAGATPLTGASPAPAAPATQPQPAGDALKRRILQIEASNQSTLKTLTSICDMAHLNLVIESRPDIEDKPATFTMKDTNVETALDATLAGLPFSYEAQGSNLFIFDRNSPPVHRIHLEVYGVGDIVDFTDANEMAGLIETVKGTVATDSWLDNGGTVASIKSVKGSLVITQIARNHREITSLLEKLREHKKDLSNSTASQAKQMQAKVQIVGNLKETVSDPEAMGIIAISELRSQYPKNSTELITMLETRLKETKSLPLRNALRLTLKDIYLENGSTTDVQRQLREILKENDVAK